MSLLSGSFLTRTIDALRRYTDEPGVNVKYSDDDMIFKISEAWSELWIELNNNNHSPILVRFDLVINTTDLSYILPANMGIIWRVASYDADTQEIIWEMYPRSYYNASGFNWRIEGNTFRLSKTWSVAETVRIDYVPCAEIKPVEFIITPGTGDEAFTSTTFEVPSVPDKGVLDTRVNAYAGYMLRTRPTGTQTPTSGDGQGHTIVQERLISAYDPITRICTLSSAFSPTFAATDNTSPFNNSAHTLGVEIIPLHFVMLESILSLRAAMNIVAIEGNKDRFKLMAQEYRSKIRSIRLALMQQLGRRANHFEGDVVENRRSISIFLGR